VLTNAQRPVVVQVDLFHQQQGTEAHHSTYLEKDEITLIDVVYYQILDEVRHWEGEEEQPIDLGAVSNSKYLGGYRWEDAKVPSIAYIRQYDKDEVQLLYSTDIVDRKGDYCVNNAEKIVYWLEGCFLEN
jgi:hypothetical protein